jgi:hypothetical protein
MSCDYLFAVQWTAKELPNFFQTGERLRSCDLNIPSARCCALPPPISHIGYEGTRDGQKGRRNDRGPGVRRTLKSALESTI